MPLRFILGALCLAPSLFLPTLAQTPNLYQQRFEQGVQLMDTNIDQAVVVFRALYRETWAVRVQLELARSLYISDDLEEAKVEFIDVLQKEIPITVRDKVEWYLNEIQKRLSVKFSIGVFQDTNPGQITSDRVFELFGQLFEYQPPTPTKTQTAFSFVAEAERELKKRSGLYAQASISTLTYETSAYNKQVLDVSLAKRWEDYNFKSLRIGNQTMFYGGQFLYNMPYVSSTLVLTAPTKTITGCLV